MSTFSLSRTVPARKETVRFPRIVRYFSQMSPAWRRIRFKKSNGMDSCYWCKHRFDDGEWMALAMREKGLNVMLCQDCCDDAGVPPEAPPPTEEEA